MKVEEKHLVGKIADFPLHVVQEMVNEQVRQGNKADPNVFAASLWSGFRWLASEKGHNFWDKVIIGRQFHLIPKPEIHIQEDSEIMNKSIKPKRKVIQISESMTSDDRYASPWNMTALCDDGSLWVISTCDGGWTRLPDIPQDGCD